MPLFVVVVVGRFCEKEEASPSQMEKDIEGFEDQEKSRRCGGRKMGQLADLGEAPKSQANAPAGQEADGSGSSKQDSGGCCVSSPWGG